MRWQYAILEDSPERVAVKLWVRPLRTPLFLEKTLAMEPGRAVLHIDEKLRNEGGEPLDVMWGHHIAFGGPFLDERTVIDTSARKLIVHESMPGYEPRRFQPGVTAQWPEAPTPDGTMADASQVPANGDMQAQEMAFSTGGPVANTGLALDRLGIKTQLMGKTGDDLYGHEIRRLCARSDPHLADGMVTDPDSSTSYTVVINPPQVDRIFLHFPGANDTFYADDVRYDLLERSRLFHFGYPPLMRMMYENEGRELAGIFRRAKTTGVTTSLDMSLPDSTAASGRADWTTILSRTLPHVDIFLPSAEEILFMLRREMHEVMTNSGDFLEQVTPNLLTELSDELLEMGAKIVVIKLGYRGFYLRTGSKAAMESLGRGRPSDAAGWANTEIWAPAFLVEEVGATGSGDSSIAGFTAALLRGLSPQEAVIAATAVGACNVEAADGLSGILPWDETHARVKAGWEKRTLSITEPGWQFDRGLELWQKTENRM